MLASCPKSPPPLLFEGIYYSHTRARTVREELAKAARSEAYVLMHEKAACQHAVGLRMNGDSRDMA